MKGWMLAAACAFPLFAGQAFAAPPSAQQVERLLRAMDVEKMVAQMIPATMAQSRALVDPMLARQNLSQAERERVERLIVAQQARMQQLLAWDKQKAIYQRVYAETLTDKEVLAMTAFYESAEGRSVMQKLPLIMQRTMAEMQPIAQEAMQTMMADLKRELDSDAPADGKR